MDVSRIEELEKKVRLLEKQNNIPDTKLVSIDNLIIIKKGLLFFFYNFIRKLFRKIMSLSNSAFIYK